MFGKNSFENMIKGGTAELFLMSVGDTQGNSKWNKIECDHVELQTTAFSRSVHHSPVVYTRLLVGGSAPIGWY